MVAGRRSETPPAPEGAPERQLRILHIEDDDADAALFSAIVKKAIPGAQVRRVVNIASGLEAIEGGDLDLVVTDLSMPGSEGTSAPKTIRTLHPELPLIVLTIRADRATMRDVLAVGADVFITKNELRGSLLSRAIGYALEKRPNGASPKR